MKRWPIVLLILLALIIVVSPGIVGQMAESNLDDSLSWLDAENDDFTITAESFDRGWFTSEGRHRITLKNGALLEVLGGDFGLDGQNSNGARLPSLIIDTRLDHGLVPLTSMGREKGSLLPGLASSVSTLKIDSGEGDLIDLPGTIYSSIGLRGNSSFHYVMEPGSQSDENSLMTWSGADITVNTLPSDRIFSAKGSIEPTTLESYGVTTDVGAVSFEVTQDSGHYSFGIGSMALDIDSVRVTSPGEPVAGFGNVSVNAVSELDDACVSGRMTVQLSRVIMPGIGTMDMDIDLALDRVDAKSLEAIVNALRDVQDSALSGAALPGIPPEMEGDLETMVSRGFEVQFRQFNISLPLGDMATTLNINIPETHHDDAFSWPSVILATTASLDLSLSTTLFDMVQAASPEATTLLAMGMLKRSGENYEMEVRYEKGLLTINGAPMPIPLGMPQ